jgi:hypothetical protein
MARKISERIVDPAVLGSFLRAPESVFGRPDL